MSVLSCHRCQRIVKSHESLLDVNASTYDLISSILPEDNIGDKTFSNEQIKTRPTVTFTEEKKHVGTTNGAFLFSENSSRDSASSNKNLPPDTESYCSSKISPQNAKKDRLNIERFNSNLENNPTDSFVMLASQLASSTLNPYSVNNDSHTSSNTTGLDLNSSISSSSMHPGLSSTARSFNLNHLLNVQNKLHDKVLGRSDFDHPLCGDCSDILVKVISRKLADATREKAKYIEFSAQRLRSSNAQTKSLDELQIELEKLEIEESSSKLTLIELEKHLDSLKNEIKELEEETIALDVQESNYWRELNAYQLQLNQFQNERDSIEAKYQYDQKQLNILHTTSVYNDLFYIPLRQGIGTINGLRLGRLPPEHPTEWNEINAAWGQTLLALHTVAFKLKFEFQGYRLNPQGSYSTVEKITSNGVEVYELFLPQDSSLSRLWLLRHYDLAMTGYLACLDQLANYARTLDSSFKPHYRIVKEKIGNHPIHFQFNTLKNWTKALRYTLCNTKILLSFAARHSTIPSPS